MAFVDQIKLLAVQAIRESIYRRPPSEDTLTSTAYMGLVGPGTYVATAGEVVLASEPAFLLQQLFVGADSAARTVFAPTLLGLLSSSNARVIARTLAATGQVDALDKVTGPDPVIEEFWRGLVHVLRFESPLFSEADLQTIEACATVVRDRARANARAAGAQARWERDFWPFPTDGEQAVPGGHTLVESTVDGLVNEVRWVISRIRYLRLAKTIREQQNPAVDADRQILLSRIQALGFSATLTSASDEIEQRAVAATSDTDVKSVMDLLRTFYEEFIEEACRKSEPKVGKPVPGGPHVAHFQPYKQYLENAGLVGPEEGEILQKLYNFLSNQGSHKLTSAPEQLRVARSTVIEWCMLIAGRISRLLI